MEKDCHNCKFELYEAYEIPCKDCGMDDREYWQAKPQTNADRIRAMSDEELVVFLDEFSSLCLNCVEDAKNKSCPIYKEGYYCRPQDIMGWLKQPAKQKVIGKL